jgi:uncharacterized membrane protein YkvA (DUF1232 family)
VQFEFWKPSPIKLIRMAFERSKEIARSFKRELIVYQRVLRVERTPLAAKLFLGLAVSYLCMPFDLIPDFIPIIGHLDDAIIMPGLVFAALRSVPAEIVSEHRAQVIREGEKPAAANPSAASFARLSAWPFCHLAAAERASLDVSRHGI